MSSVLFLAHRSRARVNARVLARRKRDDARKMAGREGEEAGGEGEGKKRHEGARKANREDVLHTREHMLGGGVRLHRRNALGRTGQDGPRENEDEISDGTKWMDGRAESAREFVCPFRRGRPPARIDSATVVPILTPLSRAELLQGKL